MDTPISVKHLLEQVKANMEPFFSSLCVVGEISNFRGLGKHWYFTLKEEGASLQCAVWASQRRTMRHVPKDGERVQVKGSLSLYVAGGTLTLSVTHCVPAGIGDLRARLLQLEAELRMSGLFDRPKKRIPHFPQRIGIIAAIGGAALWDVIRVTGQRAPNVHLLIAPAAAQGELAVSENLSALQEIQDEFWACDVILIVRGGGSLEDLWSYNDPNLVKAVAKCRLPIITGVGHEIDLTLVDLASDLRAATPSHAAELVTPDRRQVMNEIQRLRETLVIRMDWRLQMLETTLNLLIDSKPMRSVSERVERSLVLLGSLSRRIIHSTGFSRCRIKLITVVQRLHLAHPQRRLDLAVSCLMLLRQRLLYASAKFGQCSNIIRFGYAKNYLLSAINSATAVRVCRLDMATSKLTSMNPNSPLSLGFVLVTDANGNLLARSNSTPKYSEVNLRWVDGSRSAILKD